jgi:hypothetical protein
VQEIFVPESFGSTWRLAVVVEELQAIPHPVKRPWRVPVISIWRHFYGEPVEVPTWLFQVQDYHGHWEAARQVGGSAHAFLLLPLEIHRRTALLPLHQPSPSPSLILERSSAYRH